MAHLWSGRFEGDPDADLFAFGASFRFDRRLFEDDVKGSLAWAAALAKAGVLSAEDAAAIGDPGRRLHTGRSRNEQVAVDLRLYLKRRIPIIQQQIVLVVSALIDLA